MSQVIQTDSNMMSRNQALCSQTYIAINGGAQANNDPIKNIDSLIKQQKPCITNVMQPSEYYIQEARVNPKHIQRASIEDIMEKKSTEYAPASSIEKSDYQESSQLLTTLHQHNLSDLKCIFNDQSMGGTLCQISPREHTLNLEDA